MLVRRGVVVAVNPVRVPLLHLPVAATRIPPAARCQTRIHHVVPVHAALLVRERASLIHHGRLVHTTHLIHLHASCGHSVSAHTVSHCPASHSAHPQPCHRVPQQYLLLPQLLLLVQELLLIQELLLLQRGHGNIHVVLTHHPRIEVLTHHPVEAVAKTSSPGRAEEHVLPTATAHHEMHAVWAHVPPAAAGHHVHAHVAARVVEVRGLVIHVSSLGVVAGPPWRDGRGRGRTSAKNAFFGRSRRGPRASLAVALPSPGGLRRGGNRHIRGSLHAHVLARAVWSQHVRSVIAKRPPARCVVARRR
mmetsp:Transcript_3714/g.8998  ORF Transcript_3714/g.8998 Transcript_3714/m.8998 type:complete len:305 (+) Transcript_3714:2178-3092(+)